MDEMLHAKGRDIIFGWSVQVKHIIPLTKTVVFENEDNWFVYGHEEDDEDDEGEDRPVYLHSGKLQIPNRDHLTAWMAGPDRQSLIGTGAASVASPLSSLIQMGMCASISSIMETVSSEGGPRTMKAGGVDITRQLLKRVFDYMFKVKLKFFF